MDPFDRKLRNLEKIAEFKDVLGEDQINMLTLLNKGLCHAGKSEVSPHLPPALCSGCWAAPFLGFV